MNTLSLVKELKENGEDFEFYPTTKQMVWAVYQKFLTIRFINRIHSVLDIGCGTCNFKTFMQEFFDGNTNDNYRFSYYYVMEKSKILIDRLPKDAIVLGTDFNENTLIDKPVDAIFCNPPYSEFENWTERIIRESLAKYIFLVIPQRWKENAVIQSAIKHTKARAEVLGSFDFLHAERQARAKVDVLFIDKSIYRNTAFDDWFDATFTVSESKFSFEEEREEIKRELLAGKNKIELLVNGYNAKLSELHRHFRAVSSLDAETLESIGIDKCKIKEALKHKIEGLKSFYWHLSFDLLDEITSRLTSDTRKRLCERFNGLLTVDFTAENVYALLVWVCKNASAYYDEQLIELYKKLSSAENCKPFKSNQKFFDKEYWGYCSRNERKNYCLCNRIITSSLCFRSSYLWENKIDKWKSESVVNDFCAIAYNLGFIADRKEYPKEFGKKYYVYLPNGKPLMEYKIYGNGNTHLKLNPDFATAMTVEVSRLLGWIRDKSDIAKEFPDDMAKGAEKYFGIQYVAGANVPLLNEFNTEAGK